ncbi:VOC family protein [Segetibacter sp. 3557_3]|uniref:VOC family protein n=1 Tax=Segetibacter sp. 3557_3 TaxID=2547429 RepID=UPI0010584CA8|nr:VOC family protein [Segetibacter sp. 3557_3]TDH25517.1 VOC family protein [Segetibacter sp. 3557_3]
MQLTPYIHFAGNAREALDFYAGALGGEVLDVQQYGDSPVPADEDYKDKIMHARLSFDNNLIMISDVFKGQPVSTEGNVHLSLDVDDQDKIDALFSKLAEGGAIMMPLENTFWGARFGMLKDKFGVHWMLNHQLKPNPTH